MWTAGRLTAGRLVLLLSLVLLLETEARHLRHGRGRHHAHSQRKSNPQHDLAFGAAVAALAKDAPAAAGQAAAKTNGKKKGGHFMGMLFDRRLFSCVFLLVLLSKR